MTGRRLTPGVEPAGAVERGMHGLSPGHPHIADCRVSPANLRPAARAPEGTSRSSGGQGSSGHAPRRAPALPGRRRGYAERYRPAPTNLSLGPVHRPRVRTGPRGNEIMPSPVDPSPSHPARLRVGVIGAGKVGVVLGAALARAGHKLVAVTAVSDATVRRAAAMLPGVPVRRPPAVLADADLVLLTAPDA